MTAYDAGTAFLQVVPSWRGWDADVTAKIRTTQEQLRKGIADALPAGFRDGARAAAPQGAKAGEEFGGAFGRSVRLRIEAALKALPKVELRADSSDADVKLAAIRAELEDLRTKRIGIDIDEGLALAQLSRLQTDLDHLSREDPSITVRINSARASEELAAVQAEVNHLDGQTAHVNVKVDRDDAGLGGIGAFGGLPGLGGGFGLGSAGIAAAPLAVPFGAAALGLGAGVTTALGAGAAGLGVLGLGLSGVTKAVQDVSAANAQAGATATAAGAAQVRAALAVAAAERQVKSAEEGLAQARANAADAAITAQERVQSALAAQAAAERNLTTAQQTQADAQKALTEARKTAAQQLQDLSNQVTDGQLGLRQGQLDVTNARLNLQGVDSNPLSTQQQRQQAQLDYDQAVQRLKELQTQQGRLADAQKDAAKKGVAGSDVVVQAQHNLAQATQAVTDAYTAQAAAEQAVSDARRQQASQIRQSAYAIEQAQNSILSAQAAVQSASLQTSTAGGAAATRLAAMSTPLRAFATFINDTVRPAFDGLKTAIQGALLPDLQTGLSALLPLLPALTSFATGLADTMGRLFVQASRALTSPFWQGFFAFVQRTAGPVLETLADTVGNVITGFAGLIQAFWPVSKGIGDAVLSLSGRFADFATHLGSNSGFQAFLAYVKREGPAVAHFFGGIATILGQLIEGLAPLGALMLDATNKVLDLIKRLGPEGLLLAIGAIGVAAAALGGPVSLVVAGIVALEAAVVYAYEHVKPFHDFIHDHLIPVLERIWKDVLAGVRDALAQVTAAVAANKPQLQDLYSKFKTLATFIVDHVLPVLGPILQAVFKSIGVQISNVITVLGFLDDAFNKVVLPGIRLFVKLALGALRIFINGAALAFGWIPGLGPKLKTAAKQFDAFADSVNKALAGIKGVTVTVVPGYANPQDPSIGHQYASGGAVVGIGGWTSDSIAARLSNGEHVWPAREVAALGGQQAMYQLRHVLTGYAAGGAVGPSAGLLSAAAATRGAGLTRLSDLAGGAAAPLHYEQHLHYPVPDSVSHGQMRAQQLLLHELSNR